MKLSLSRISEIVSSSVPCEGMAIAQGYSIDSRTIRQGELFFAVKGERFDGHDFVEQALANGAVAAVVNKDQTSRYRDHVLAVEDTLLALQKLAAETRRLWGKPLVGVTGSTGKTTTKEAIAHVLSQQFHVLKSEGNLNNHFGLPLMLMRLEAEHEIAVVEMGMSHAGEISALAKIAQPNIGVVTNVAPVHLEFFNSVAEIAHAKRELIESLPSDGTAVLNGDDEYVSQFGEKFAGKTVRYGFHLSAQVRAENIEVLGANGSTFDIIAGGHREKAELPLIGVHNIQNSLAAVAVALQMGMSLKAAVSSLSTLSAPDKRGQVIQLGNITVINDCYNSNPKALAAMVDALVTMPAKRRIVIAGEMLELGPEAEELHRESARHIADRKIDALVGVRGLAESMVGAALQAGVAAKFVNTPEEAGEWLAAEARDGDVVLLKASRGVKLERALEVWMARSEALASHK